jgi:hypothetical protein
MFSRPHQITTACAAACLVSTLAVGLTACGDSAEPLGDGSLALSWQVSPHGCDVAGVETVEVRLQNAHRTRSESYACVDGEALVEDIAPAKYDLVIVGIDSGDNETFISGSRLVTLGAEKLNETSRVRLTAKPASVEAAWRFENGRVCGANGVSRVEVAVYDQAFYEIARTRFECDRGIGLIEGLAAGDYIVEAVAEADDEVLRGVAETTLKRGDHATVDVELARD